MSEAPLRTQNFLAFSQTHGRLAGDQANSTNPWQLQSLPPWDASPLGIAYKFDGQFPSLFPMALSVCPCHDPLLPSLSL